MVARGVHFAITPEERTLLESFGDDDSRIRFVQEDLEEGWNEDYLVETDKAWDAIHRCLGEFPPDTPWFYPVDPAHGAFALPEEHGTYPLKLCVMGGKRITDQENRFIIRLIEPEAVADIAAALQPIDETALRDRYFRHCKGAWPEFGEEDFEYTWEYFEELRDYFARMAGNGRTIIFTTDH